MAAERRFQLQLEEIRQRSQEDRFQLAKFLADTQVHAAHSNSSGSSSSPEAISRKFSRLNKEAQELLQDLKERHSSQKPLHEVEVIYKALDGAMDDLKSLVDSKADTIHDDGTREAILSQFQRTKSQYYAEAALAKSYISTVKAAKEQDKQAGCLPSGISPPVFYGDKMKFPSFWDAFAPLVHNNPKVSRFHKMTYLKMAMKGDASNTLENYPTTAENYDAAVEAVNKRFGRKQAIVRSHIKDLLDFSKADYNAKQLRSLLDKISAKQAILQQHNVTFDQVLTQIIEMQLPKVVEERWIRKLSPLIESDTAPSVQDLLDFLTSELATLETLTPNSSGSSKPKGKFKSSSNHVAKQGFQREKQFSPSTAQALVTQTSSHQGVKDSDVCVLCSKQHLLVNCSEFLKLSPAQRLGELLGRPGKICFKCLQSRTSEGHPPNFRRCTASCCHAGCNKPHHQLLHVEEPKLPDKTSANLAAINFERGNGESNLLNVNNSTTILPTAMAVISAGGKEQEVRVAFDSFSQKSFVTRQVANALNLTSLRKDYLNIAGFGGSLVTEHMDWDHVISNLRLLPKGHLSAC